MSSILTNTSAMVALQTLKGINSSLAKTQSEISTGKSVSSAKDNSAIWAISKVMESDVSGFETVSTSLASGQSMVSVARTAVESITDDLKSIKEKVVAAQDDSADTTKLQNQVDELVSLIKSKISGAQFNGVNLINQASGTSVLGSIDRSATGSVTANPISIDAQDMRTGAVTAGTGTIAAGTIATGLTAGAGTHDGSATIGAAASVGFTLAASAADDTITVTLGDKNFSYSISTADAAAGNDANAIALTNLRDQINASGITGVTALYDSSKPGELTINNAGSTDISMTVRVRDDGDGKLAGLDSFSVTSGTALADIETMINNSIDAAAAFGAVESRMESQASFVSDLTDALKTGIGSLVDADMEEASARLQALQTQQQLGIQSLSIANQQPQNILSLFK